MRQEQYPKDYEGRMVLYERNWGIKNPRGHDFLKNMSPNIVEHRLDGLKHLLSINNAGDYVRLLYYTTEVLELRAKTLDRIQGLKVSYTQKDGIEKVEPMILASNPSTVRENLVLLNANGINHIQHSNLLFKVSTFKLRSNIDFLRAINMNLSQQPEILLDPTWQLKTNYFVATLLGLDVDLTWLSYSTDKLIDRVREYYELSGPGVLPINIETAPANLDTILLNITEMSVAQKEFYDWLKNHSGEDMHTKLYQADKIFHGKYGLERLNSPAFSVFVFTTVIHDPSSDFAKAIVDFTGHLLNAQSYDLRQLHNDLSNDFNLTPEDMWNLSTIMHRETEE